MRILDKKKNWLVLPGGSDICPSLYGKKNFKSYTSEYSRKRDEHEVKLYKEAVAQGRPVFSICRGLQLVSALNGLTLIQNIRHTSSHDLLVRDVETDNFEGKRVMTNSIHHQLVWTENKLEGENFKVYGYTNISPIHEYQEDEEINCFIEPEIIHFPKTNSFGVQGHPENMDYSKAYEPMMDYLNDLLKKLF